RVLATLGGNGADRPAHVRDGDEIHAVGEILDRESELLRNLLEGFPRRRQVQRHFAARQTLRIQVAEHRAGIGERRLASAEAVADRAGTRAGAARADAQRAAAVDPDDAAAAGADLGDIDGRRAQHVAAAARHAAGTREAGADLVFLGVGDLAIL